MLRATVNRPVCPSIRPSSGARYQFFFPFHGNFLYTGAFFPYGALGRHQWREDGSVIYSCCCTSLAQSLLGLSPTGLITISFLLSQIWDSPNLEASFQYLFPQDQGSPVTHPGIEFVLYSIYPGFSRRWLWRMPSSGTRVSKLRPVGHIWPAKEQIITAGVVLLPFLH
jgi:hypothetical protein